MPSEDNNQDRRTEPRATTDTYYSVEFSIGGAYSFYQFKLRDISNKGICILIRKDSAILKDIHAGDVIEMKYYSDGKPVPTGFVKTEIKHVTLEESGRYADHYLVGLSILDE